MRRLALLLLSGLQLARGRQPGFSVYQDLLAHPQFEVVFSNELISETDAAALAARQYERQNEQHPAYTATFGVPEISAEGGGEKNAGQHHTGDEIQKDDGPTHEDDREWPRSMKYEYIKVAPSTQYLCAIPVVAPPEPSPPATSESSQLAREEEARELERGSDKGWQLLSGMHAQCLYFMAGWWSYSFCGAREVIQFHALPRLPNGAAPPAHDPNTAAYILGQSAPAKKGENDDEWQLPKESRLAHFKGDQLYLVQRLGGGTVCDLTGRERTIEIQYHCSPGLKSDRIAWIKEVTTCSYQMVVHTPRLCEEALFLPPPEVAANPITCRPVGESVAAVDGVAVDGVDKVFDGDSPQTDVQVKQAKAKTANSWKDTNVGGIIVGGNRVLKKGEHQQVGGAGRNAPAWYQRDGAHIIAAPVPVVKKKKASTEGKGDEEDEEEEVFELHLAGKDLEMLGLDVGDMKKLQRQLQEMTTEDMLEIDVVEDEDGVLEYRVRLGNEEEEERGSEEEMGAA